MAVAALVGALGLGASAATASRSSRTGIFDDAQILYGNPDKVFPSLAQLDDAADPRQPLVGRAERRRQAAAGERDEPERPGLRLGDLRPHRPVRVRSTGSSAVFTIIGTPPWANGRPAGTSRRRTSADLQAFATAAARRYSGHLQGAGRPHRCRASASWIAWNEPNNPVFLKPQFVTVGRRSG